MHKFVVIGVWLVVGVGLASALPQLETLVRQQFVATLRGLGDCAPH